MIKNVWVSFQNRNINLFVKQFNQYNDIGNLARSFTLYGLNFEVNFYHMIYSRIYYIYCLKDQVRFIISNTKAKIIKFGVRFIRFSYTELTVTGNVTLNHLTNVQ